MRDESPAEEPQVTGTENGAPDDNEQLVARVRELARVLAKRYQEFDPDALVDDQDFEAGITLLQHGSVPAGILVSLARDSHTYVAALALAAIARRQDGTTGWEKHIIKRLGRASTGELAFLLTVLGAAAREPVLARVLAAADHEWLDPSFMQVVREFIDARVAAGDSLDPASLAGTIAPHNESVVTRLVESAGDLARSQLDPAIREWRGSLVDEHFFKDLGRIVSSEELPEPTLIGARETAIEAVVAALEADPPRSILLVGEQGVGKTMLIGEALRRLEAKGWFAFQAAASEVMAGQMYIGMFEGRVQEIAQRMVGRRVVWLFPNFEEALWAGQHLQSPRGLLDALLPRVETRQIAIIGETDPLAYELLVQLRPKVARAFETVRLPPMSEDDALAVARDWASNRVSVAEDTLREAHDLAVHYLPGTAAPGNVVRLLELTLQRGTRLGDVRVTPETVIETLSEATGLPLHVLDPRTPLDLDDVKRFFSERVLGQIEAVECLVERIALVKAGLTDPSRPLGVFLFVGPTGTGKTEIAKTLAAFLFGSEERLVRLDMTEFQTPESLERLLADSAVEPQAAPLISSIRKHPFSVVLLDEFEKAHPNIWDVFLQVFDDGRLTDRSARTVDLRHCVLILTSNVGSAIPTGPGLGFAPQRELFNPAAVERAVKQSFRPELLNRLDRIVVFRPLERDVMRTLVEHELTAVLERRGFRMHPWAVEWDDAAIDFLLERGFSAELGARPLKRAIEQHLLAPLAMSIVERQFPQGDQFLFITARDGREIAVDFVDPDADSTGAPPVKVRRKPEDLQLETLILDPHGERAEMTYLAAELERVRARLPQWLEQKEAGLEEMRDPSFWDSPDRHVALGRIEYLDRLEAATATAERLFSRLARREKGTGAAAADLVSMLAQRLHVLNRALEGLETGDPSDAVLAIRVPPTTGKNTDAASSFADDLASMYRSWSDRRGMRIRELESQAADDHVFVVAGLGAYTILKHEAGLHVLELPLDNRKFARVPVMVNIAPFQQVDGISAHDQARRALADAGSSRTVVRRYRTGPSPLVRDSRGWRSGHLDAVLAGDFDVMG